MISNNHTFINFLRIVHTNGRFEFIQLQFWREYVILRKHPNYFSISTHFFKYQNSWPWLFLYRRGWGIPNVNIYPLSFEPNIVWIWTHEICGRCAKIAVAKTYNNVTLLYLHSFMFAESISFCVIFPLWGTVWLLITQPNQQHPHLKR